MSGTADNLLGGRSSLPISAPQVVNPLDAINAGNQAASNYYDLQQKRAQQALGGILQQATDANGNVNYAKARQLAAAAGPVVQMGMASYLKDNAVLSTNQLNFNDAQQAEIGKGLGSMIVQPDQAQTPAAYKAQLVQLHANGTIDDSHLAAANSAIDGLGPNPSPTALRLTATRMLMTSMSTQDIANRSLPTTTLITGSQGTFPYTTNPAPVGGPPTGALVQNPGAFTQGVAPQIPMAPDRRPGAPANSYTPVVPPGGGGTQPLPATGSGSATATPPTPPKVGAPPLPTGYKPRAAATPATTPPAPNAPAAPASTPPPVPSPSPVTAGTYTAPPQTQPESLAANVKAYTEDQAQVPAIITRAQNMGHAYDALTQLKSATGKGAQGINDLRSYAQTLGILPPGAVSEQQLFEVVNKYTERAMLDAAGGGSTDLGKRLQETANPGTSLSTPANLELLRNDMGKTLQTLAAQKSHDPALAGAGYLAHRGDIASTTDPRGFVWNMYSPEEQAKILADVAKDKTGAAADNLHRAIGMSRRLQLQVPVSPPPSGPQKQSFNATPAPAPNPLSMTG